MNEMPIPSWTKDVKKQMFEAHGAIDYNQGGAEVRSLDKILDFSTLFSKFFERGDTLVVQLFPRNGKEDHYYPEKERDGKLIPGRLDLSFRDIQFPNNMEELIKEAADDIWMGDVAIEPVAILRYDDDDDVVVDEPKEKSTGSYVVQFQGVKTAAHIIGPKKFVDTFCDRLDKSLEPA